MSIIILSTGVLTRLFGLLTTFSKFSLAVSQLKLIFELYSPFGGVLDPPNGAIENIKA